VIGADGSPLRTDVTGNDHLKATVDEHFAFEVGRAHWESTSEEGHSATPGFCISANGPATEPALLASALLKAKGAPSRLIEQESQPVARNKFLPRLAAPLPLSCARPGGLLT
jgi:hypothetical protein